MSVYVRPEDLRIRVPGETADNVLAGRVEKLEFLGAFCRVSFRIDGTAEIVADLSYHDVDRTGVQAGARATSRSIASMSACSRARRSDCNEHRPDRAPPRLLRPTCGRSLHWHDRIAQLALVAMAALMSMFLLLPLALVVQKCFVDADGRFVGAHNFVEYLEDSGVLRSMLHSDGRARSSRRRADGVHVRVCADALVHAAEERGTHDRAAACSHRRCCPRCRSSTGSATRGC